MKIVYLLDDFPPKSFSSASTITFNLAKELLNLGHEIFVITRTDEKKDSDIEEYCGIKIFRIYSQYPSLLRHWMAVLNPQVVFKIKKILKKIKPDICHFHHIHTYLSYYGLRLAKKYSGKIFLTAHDAMLFHYNKLMPKESDYICKVKLKEQIREAGRMYNPFRNLLIRYYLKSVDKIFSVSDSLKKLLIANGIKNVETIYNGINVRDWEGNSEEGEQFKKKYGIVGKKILFFGGRISGAKGGDQILSALLMIKKIINDVVLIVVGEENQYTQTMKTAIKELGLDKNVVFTGFLLGVELRAAYYATDICISPSICFETFGMINLEAMVCKKPVISSCFGGPSEIILDNETGYLLNPYDEILMAEKIIDLLKNPQKARHFGEAGYERTKKCFSLSRQVERTLQYYNKPIKTAD